MKKFLLILSIVIASLTALVALNPSMVLIGLNVMKSIEHKVERGRVDLADSHWAYNKIPAKKTADKEQVQTLILLHGFGGSKESWIDIMPHLAESFTVIAVDIPGFGESSKNPNDDYGIYSQVARLQQFVDALDLKHFHLAGNSMGGAIAGTFAARHPDKVLSLWLLNPAGVESAQRSEFDLFYEEKGENVMLASTVEELDKQLAWLYHSSPEMPNLIKQGIVDLIGNSDDLSAKMHQDLTQSWPPLEQELQGFSKPALITWGDQDRLTHISGVYVLKDVMPQAKLNIMVNIGHVPMLEVPAKTAQAFIEFSKI